MAKSPDKPTTETPADDKPDYQAEIDKWKALARKHEAQAKDNYEELETLKKDADASKSDMDKLRESISTLEERTAKAEREALVARVAKEKNLPTFIADRLRGDNLEDIQKEADEAIEALGLSDKDEDDDPPKPGVGRPKEKLQAGASNEDDEPEITPEKGEEIAESIRKSETF